MSEAEQLAADLARVVASSSLEFDLVVGIANGGVHPAIHTANALGLPVTICRVKRRTSQLKEKLGFARKALSSPLLKRPVRRANRLVDRLFSGVGKADQGFDQEMTGKKILVVDDCVDSGASLAHVQSMLAAAGASSVKSAVFSWTRKFDSAALNGIAPDFYLSRSLPSFPWSADNPDYPAFKAWLAEHLT